MRRPVSNAEINRERTTLKRMFSPLDAGREAAPQTAHSPTGREQHADGVLRAGPVSIRAGAPARRDSAIVTFTYITGWRIASEVLPLEWRHVNFRTSEVRLDAGTTKNNEGRVFVMTDDLRALLEAQQAEHDPLKKAGTFVVRVLPTGGRRARRREEAPPRESPSRGHGTTPVGRPAVPAASRTTCAARLYGTWSGWASPSASR